MIEKGNRFILILLKFDGGVWAMDKLRDMIKGEREIGISRSRDMKGVGFIRTCTPPL